MASLPKLYTRFAKYYDRLESQYRDYEKEARWLDSVLGKGSGRIIDVSCGTASHLSNLLTRSKREAFAMDVSKDMIDVASKKLKNQKSGCEFLLGDFLSIPFGNGSFDAAICMYWSLAGLDHGKTLSLFQEVSRVLNRRGLFVFDVENAEGIKENLLDEPFIDNFFQVKDEGLFVIRANLSRKVAKDVVFWRAYYLLERGGVSELFEDSMNLRFYSKKTLVSILTEAGLKLKGVYSSPFKMYKRRSASLYFVAEKP